MPDPIPTPSPRPHLDRCIAVERDGTRVELCALRGRTGPPGYGVRQQVAGGEWRFLSLGRDRRAQWAAFDRAVEGLL